MGLLWFLSLPSFAYRSRINDDDIISIIIVNIYCLFCYMASTVSTSLVFSSVFTTLWDKYLYNRLGNSGLVRLSNWPEGTELVSDGVVIQSHWILRKSLCFWPLYSTASFDCNREWNITGVNKAWLEDDNDDHHWQQEEWHHPSCHYWVLAWIKCCANQPFYLHYLELTAILWVFFSFLQLRNWDTERLNGIVYIHSPPVDSVPTVYQSL